MGNDGGTIPTRREILDLDNRKDRRQESQILIDKSNRQNDWKYCKLSSNKLIKNQVVSDYRGQLFNKESVIEFLIEKKKLDEFQHINSINDIVNLTNFKDLKNPESGDEYCYLVPCGDISESNLIKELSKSGVLNCPVCNMKILQRDAIDINSNNEKTIHRLQQRIEQLNDLGLYHNLEKRKRKKKRKMDKDDSDVTIKKGKV